MSEFSVDQGGGRHYILRRIFRSLLPRDHIEVLEIGAYVGQSAALWSALIVEHCPAGGRVLCVDSWHPYHPPEDIAAGGIYVRMEAALRDGSAFEEFKRHAAEADPKAPIHYLRGTLEEVLPEIVRGGPFFDLVYIDGSHYYVEVRKDLLMAQHLVQVGGLLCGDDLEEQLSSTNAQWCRENGNRDYLNNCHPGVTLAVGEVLGPVWSDNGVWGVQKRIKGFGRLEAL